MRFLEKLKWFQADAGTSARAGGTGPALSVLPRAPAPANDASRPVPVPVIYASQTGTAEDIARQTAFALAAAGTPAEPVPIASAWALLQSAPCLLFVASTTGDGDAPHDALPFTRAMVSAPDLAHARVGVLALGDSDYSDFCGFGRQLDAWLQARGARPLFPRIDMDDGDPAALAAWHGALQLHCVPSRHLAWHAPGVAPWRLRARYCLNPGSPGAPAWHLELVPGAVPLPAWQAGDIAEVHIDRESPREYSIASLPGDGALHLLVREHRRADGTPGIASQRLCRDVQAGATVALRIRRNSAFHPPADERPMLLVGSGTGMAGLRALLKAREAAGHHRNWLLFGEREPGVDAWYATDLQRWQGSGVLQRLDLAWSRGPEPAYVQQRLLDAAMDLRRWIADGAAIYVCGSADGMGKGVDTALRQLLGDDRVAALTSGGRYRRDVY